MTQMKAKLETLELLDSAKWDLDGLTNESEGILDDFELGQVYAALTIVLGITDRFVERNKLGNAHRLIELKKKRELIA